MKKLGLVLSGGGAKGAYQAGVIKYLAEQNVEPDIIAGTSIGALNGAILSSSKNFKNGAEKLLDIWQNIGEQKILEFNKTININGWFKINTTQIAFSLLEKLGLKNKNYFFNAKPIEDIIKKHISFEKVKYGKEFWLTVFPVLTTPLLQNETIFELILSTMLNSAEYINVNSIKNETDFHNSILASAAIPLAFPSRKINNKVYVDGGVADNVPLKAIENKVEQVIVVHTHHNSIWNSNDFNNTILEIRPNSPMSEKNTFFSNIEAIFDFSSDKINLLIEIGYNDAQSIYSNVKEKVETFRKLENTTDALLNSYKQFEK